MVNYNFRFRASFFFFFLCATFIVSATTRLYVPAVDSNGKGILTTIDATAIGGAGDVYMTTEPLVSVETQHSERTATKVAAELAGVNRSNYDLLFKIHAEAEVVDGPSGGAAMTLLAYAELANKTPRKDFSITGTIEGNGGMGKVGGIKEKAEAVAKQGLKVFLIPRGQGTDGGVDVIEYAKQKWGLQVVEVENAREAINIAFSPEGSLINVSGRVEKPLVLPSASPSDETKSMKAIAESELLEAGNQLLSLNLTGSNEKFVLEQLNTSKLLLEKGYYYSAANTVFVLKINMLAYSLSNISRQEFREKVDGLEKAIAGYSDFVQPDEQNWEWVAGAKVRYYWTKLKAREVKENLGSKLPQYLL
ncbi:hypothetical protein HY991_00010, partial [Candidatus Micrarchaeota archaeon]|nr:hypothetical protein [Candidatus Micrarchaeota archaeon]